MVQNQKADRSITLDGYFLSSFMQHAWVLFPLVRLKEMVRQGKAHKRRCFSRRNKPYVTMKCEISRSVCHKSYRSSVAKPCHSRKHNTGWFQWKPPLPPPLWPYHTIPSVWFSPITLKAHHIVFHTDLDPFGTGLPLGVS